MSICWLGVPSDVLSWNKKPLLCTEWFILQNFFLIGLTFMALNYLISINHLTASQSVWLMPSLCNAIKVNFDGSIQWQQNKCSIYCYRLLYQTPCATSQIIHTSLVPMVEPRATWIGLTMVVYQLNAQNLNKRGFIYHYPLLEQQATIQQDLWKLMLENK